MNQTAIMRVIAIDVAGPTSKMSDHIADSYSPKKPDKIQPNR